MFALQRMSLLTQIVPVSDNKYINNYLIPFFNPINNFFSSSLKVIPNSP